MSKLKKRIEMYWQDVNRGFLELQIRKKYIQIRY